MYKKLLVSSILLACANLALAETPVDEVPKITSLKQGLSKFDFLANTSIQKKVFFQLSPGTFCYWLTRDQNAWQHQWPKCGLLIL